MASQNFMKLAEALAGDFTVYVPDRRGRGMSGSHGDYSLLKEAEDMQALIHKTGAQRIFGLSSGAIVSLQTAMIEPSLRKVALFEPPLPVQGAQPAHWVDNYEKALAKENFGAALISVARGTDDSSFFIRLPRFIITPILNLAIKADAKELKPDHVNLKTLIASMRYDVKAVMESEGILKRSDLVTAEMLLLGGKRSQRYLKIALDAVNIAFPKAKRIEFAGLGHLAAENGGNPAWVAKELKTFFIS